MKAQFLDRDADTVFFDGKFARIHAPFRDALLDRIFEPDPGLDVAKSEITYRRAVVIKKSVGDLSGHVRRNDGLFALAGWAPLLDVDLFSILVVHYNLGLGTLRDLGGGRPEIEEIQQRLEELRSFSAYMATEIGHGNNLAALRTEARYDRKSQTFVINTPDDSAKKFMSTTGSAIFPKTVILLARLFVDEYDHGVFPFLLDLADEGGTIAGITVEPVGPRPGQFSDMAITSFRDVRIDKWRLLSEGMARLTDDGIFEPVIKNPRTRFLRAASRLLQGRLCVANAAAAVSRASIFIAARYSETRKTNAPGRTDATAADYLVHSRDVCTALASTVAVTALVNKTSREFTPTGEDAALDASLCKVFATVEAFKVVASCRERCGAQGTLGVNRIADYLSFIDGMRTAEGDNLVLLSTTAAQLLSRTPPERRRPPDLSECVTLDTMLAVLEARYAALWHELQEAHDAARTVDGVFEAWNTVSTRAIGIGRLRAVIAAVAEMKEMTIRSESLRTPLALLGEIFALSEILAHQGWCVAEGLAASDPSQVLGKRIDMACVALRSHVPSVVACFGLSADLLRAPIARTTDVEADFGRNTASASHF